MLGLLRQGSRDERPVGNPTRTVQCHLHRHLHRVADPLTDRSCFEPKENRVQYLSHHQGLAVARLDACSGDRSSRARRDPADRLPRPVPLERQRLDGADARARRQEPDPEGHVRHRDRREAALPGGDARRRTTSRSGAISDPAYLNGRVAVARHLPRPADHDGRRERRAHGCDPDPARRNPAGRGDLGRRRRRASSATSRAATASTSTTRSRRPEATRSVSSRRTSSSCGAGETPAIIRADAPLAQKLALASCPARCGSCFAPPGTRSLRRGGRSRATTSLQQITRQPKVVR